MNRPRIIQDARLRQGLGKFVYRRTPTDVMNVEELSEEEKTFLLDYMQECLALEQQHRWNERSLLDFNSCCSLPMKSSRPYSPQTLFESNLTTEEMKGVISEFSHQAWPGRFSPPSTSCRNDPHH